MKLIQSVFMICLLLFANLNVFVYQNWCHGENIGYTVNSKKFDTDLKASSSLKEIPSFSKDNCCKDVLIKYNENSFFSSDTSFQFHALVLLGIIPDTYRNIEIPLFNQKVKTPQLYSNPPPLGDKLYQLYCRYTYYG